MGMEQETLIYVEENDKEEAKILTKGLLNKDVKSRAYINALGAELGLKYLALENINSTKTYNLHNVHRILEEFDISDIMLSNIHIDVRVVFDENKIFIPKSHFEYEILPDIYLVFVLSEDSSHVKFLGFFEPKLINKNNQNSDYYFIEKEKLSSALNLKQFVESFKGNTTQSLSDDINETAQTLMVSLVDQNASKDEMKELLKYLSQSLYLRDRFIEFENFEILSYKAERSDDVTVPKEIEQDGVIDATIDDLRGIDIENSDNENFIGTALETSAEIAGAALGVSAIAGLAAEAAGAAAFEGAAALGESVVEAASDIVSEISENVIENAAEMFTADSIPSMLDNDEQEDFTDSQSDSCDPVAFDDTSIAESAENPSKNDDSVISILDDNADDFFNELGLGETEDSEESLSFENIDTSKGKIEMEEAVSSDAVDFDTVEQSEIPQQTELSADEQMEVLDISNVDAVPNNLDENISETIEFNNIELSSEPPCLNELNGEDSVPMLNMNDFSPLEPLPETDSFKAESYDMDSLTITDNMMSMPKIDKAVSNFGPVDIEELSIQEPMAPAAQSLQDETVQESGFGDMPSELDSIPDFNADSMGMDFSEEISQDNSELSESTLDSSDEMPSDSLDLPSVDELDNLSVDDIVEEPVIAESPVTDFNSIEQIDNFASDPMMEESVDVPVSDFDSLAQVDEFEGVESAGAEIPSIDEAMEADFNDSDEIPEIGEGEITSESEEYDESVENEEPVFDQSDEETEVPLDDENDLTMLFNEGSGEEHLPEDFNTLNQLSQIPSVQAEKPKIPVKIVAVAAVAAVLAIGSIAGLSMKNKSSTSEPEPLAQAVPETQDVPAPIADNSNILANTPEVQTLPAEQKEPVNVKQKKTEAKEAKSDKPVNPTGTYMGVTKLSWEVPDYLSYSANMKKYLQTAGKSIKLTLSSDLLLTTEYAYSNQMKVDLQLSSDGTLKDSKIVKSSGSEQIDKIVLQTVKETLNVIKPATGEVPTPEFHLALIINF